MSAVESILTTLIGVLGAATVLAAGLWRPLKWLMRRVETHVIETVDERLTIQVGDMGRHTDQLAKSMRAVTREVGILGRWMRNHNESGRHTA